MIIRFVCGYIVNNSYSDDNNSYNNNDTISGMADYNDHENNKVMIKILIIITSLNISVIINHNNHYKIGLEVVMIRNKATIFIAVHQ